MDKDLGALVISGKELDRKLVAEILSPYVRLDKDACDIRPLKPWDGIKADLKILIYLLARKAMLALGFNLDVEGATASEVISRTGLKSGTVHPALRNLLNDRIVEQTKDRRYFIPNHAIERIKDMLKKD